MLPDIEPAVFAAWTIMALLLIPLSYFAIRQNVDGVIAYAIAVMFGFSMRLSLVATFVLAIAFCTIGDRMKAAYAILGFVIGLAFWVGLFTFMTFGTVAGPPELLKGLI